MFFVRLHAFQKNNMDKFGQNVDMFERFGFDNLVNIEMQLMCSRKISE